MPSYFVWLKGDDMSRKLNALINSAFRRIYGEKSSMSTKDRKEWAAFLHARGIFWEVKMKNKPNWEGWVAIPTDGYYICRPDCMDTHIRVGRYFVPADLATRMLALQSLL